MPQHAWIGGNKFAVSQLMDGSVLVSGLYDYSAQVRWFDNKAEFRRWMSR